MRGVIYVARAMAAMLAVVGLPALAGVLVVDGVWSPAVLLGVPASVLLGVILFPFSLADIQHLAAAGHFGLAALAVRFSLQSYRRAAAIGEVMKIRVCYFCDWPSGRTGDIRPYPVLFVRNGGPAPFRGGRLWGAGSIEFKYDTINICGRRRWSLRRERWRYPWSYFDSCYASHSGMVVMKFRDTGLDALVFQFVCDPQIIPRNVMALAF